jgi:alanine racemase
MEMAQALSKAAAKRERSVKVHIKINTGMWGIGVWADEAVRFIKEILDLGGLEVEGIFSHLATAYSRDKGYAYEQFELFSGVINRLKEEGIHIPLVHIASSAAILDLPEMNLNMVRPGIALYGLYPSRMVSRQIELRPVMGFKTRIVHLERVPKGSGLSYGRTYVAAEDMLVAVLPVGYANGYTRVLSNKAWVLVRGERARVVGTICMDYCLIDVSHIRGVSVGDEVVLFGEQLGERIEVDELAGLCETINYEIICSVGSRVPRVYIDR